MRNPTKSNKKAVGTNNPVLVFGGERLIFAGMAKNAEGEPVARFINEKLLGDERMPQLSSESLMTADGVVLATDVRLRKGVQ